MKTRLYNILSLSMLIGGLITIYSYNCYVDPFGINNYYREKGYNLHKPEFWLNTRIYKVFNVLDVSPEVVFFWLISS